MWDVKLNQAVWFPKAKKKAIVKEFLPNRLVRITYFNRDDQRVVEDVPRKDIQEYKAPARPLKIKVKYFADIEKIKPISIGDWIDLRAAEDVELKAGEFKLIPLGVGMKLPTNYEANIVPRSSTFKNWGILQTNHYAIIDNSFSGNNDQWFFPVYATRDTLIEKDSRICQFRLNEIMPKIIIEEVESLDEISRGGHGSTGVS